MEDGTWYTPAVYEAPRAETIGVLFGCFGRKIDGDSWFTWWLNHPWPSICPKRTPMAETLRWSCQMLSLGMSLSWGSGRSSDNGFLTILVRPKQSQDRLQWLLCLTLRNISLFSKFFQPEEYPILARSSSGTHRSDPTACMVCLIPERQRKIMISLSSEGLCWQRHVPYNRCAYGCGSKTGTKMEPW